MPKIRHARRYRTAEANLAIPSFLKAKPKPEYKRAGNDHLAMMSSAAYGGREWIDKISQQGYEMDMELSDDNAKVFHNSRNGGTVIAYRGTRPTNTDDLSADFEILKGSRKHHRFDEAVDLANRVRRKYNGPITATGHSLGGTLALHVNKTLDIPTQVYNPGSSPIWKENIDKDNVMIVRNENDLVSSGVKSKNMEERRSNLFSQMFQRLSPLRGWLYDHGMNNMIFGY